jgi:hypothetical protein
MPSDEGRRRRVEAELYKKVEQQKADEARRESQERLRNFSRKVNQNIQERKQRIDAIRERFGLQ